MKTKYYLSSFSLILSILACGFPSSPPVEPTVNALPPTPNLPFSPTTAPATQVPPPAAAATPFSGTWQGTDPDDGSTITLTVTQTGQNLTGNFSDTFSGTVPPPGYQGPGTGSTLSSTSAQMTFNLTRHDGKSGTTQFSLELTDGNNTMIFTPVGGKNIFMQKK